MKRGTIWKTSLLLGTRVGWCLGGAIGRAAIGVVEGHYRIPGQKSWFVTVVIESVENERDRRQVGNPVRVAVADLQIEITGEPPVGRCK